tara:strand:+ start:124 stop:297 length:174 start_codon:yes stop_codon:yes gene_type:complete
LILLLTPEIICGKLLLHLILLLPFIGPIFIFNVVTMLQLLLRLPSVASARIWHGSVD